MWLLKLCFRAPLSTRRGIWDRGINHTCPRTQTRKILGVTVHLADQEAKSQTFQRQGKGCPVSSEPGQAWVRTPDTRALCLLRLHPTLKFTSFSHRLGSHLHMEETQTQDYRLQLQVEEVTGQRQVLLIPAEFCLTNRAQNPLSLARCTTQGRHVSIRQLAQSCPCETP